MHMMLQRRQALGLLSALPLAGLARCGSGGSSVMSLAQGIADEQGIVNTLTGEVPIFQTLFPNALTPAAWGTITNAGKTGYLDLAAGLLADLATNAPTAITDAATAERDINLVVEDLAPIAQAVASSNPALAAAAGVVEAAIVLLPGIETLFNQLTGTASTASAKALPAAARARALASPLTVAQARARLHIPTVP